jgi:DNA polymerase-4
MRTDDKAYGVMVRMIHKAASRMRQLDYCASRLIVRIDYIKQPTWEVTVKLSLTRDTISFVHALAEAWPDHPPGRLYRVSIILTQLVATHSAPLPLFAGQTQSNKIANVMEKIDHKYGLQTIYSGAMCGHTKKSPARISFTQIPELEDDEM